MSRKPLDRPQDQPHHEDQQRERQPGADQPEPQGGAVGGKVIPFPVRRARVRRQAKERERLVVRIGVEDWLT